jgi:ribulose-phosphate 3-epimerase
VQRATEGGATVVHVDIMDGHFVPNLTIGPPVVKSLRKATDLPLDCHLMIENADEFIPAFAEAGANWISVHQEACVHLDRTLHHIRDHGALAGVVINPATPVALLSEVLDIVDYVLVMSVNPGFGGQSFIPSAHRKVREMKTLVGSRTIDISVDGGVKADLARSLAQDGASILVAGSAVFGAADPAAAVRAIRAAATA